MSTNLLDSLISQIGDAATKSLVTEFKNKADKIILVLEIAVGVNVLTWVLIAAMWYSLKH